MMNRVLKRAAVVVFSGMLIATSVGCPDYSHLREVPDYENMTDSAGEVPDETGKLTEGPQDDG